MNKCHGKQIRCSASKRDLVRAKEEKARLKRNQKKIENVMQLISEIYSDDDRYHDNARARNEFTGELMYVSLDIKKSINRANEAIKDMRKELKEKKKKK